MMPVTFPEDSQAAPVLGYSGLVIESDPPAQTPGPCIPRSEWSWPTPPPSGWLWSLSEAQMFFWMQRAFDLDYEIEGENEGGPYSGSGSLTARPAGFTDTDHPMDRVCLASGVSSSSTSGTVGEFNATSLNRIFRGIGIFEVMISGVSQGYALGWPAFPDIAVTGIPNLYQINDDGFGTTIAAIVGVSAGSIFDLDGTNTDYNLFASISLGSTRLPVMVAVKDGDGSPTVNLTGDGTSAVTLTSDGLELGDYSIEITASNSQIYTLAT